MNRVSPCHHGPPWGHLTSFQVGLRSSGTTRVLLGTPGGGDTGGRVVARQGGDIGVQGEGWHCPHARGWPTLIPGVAGTIPSHEDATPVHQDGRCHLVTRRWPVPCGPMGTATAVSPPLVPSGTSEAGRHVHAGPGAGGPRDVGTGHQQPQHGRVPRPPRHGGAVTEELPPRRWDAFQNGTVGGTLLLAWLGGCHRVTACLCHRVPMPPCPHVTGCPYL